MKKTLLICSGLILFIPLTSIAVDVAHKVGIIITNPLIVQNIQNLSFGVWIPDSRAIDVELTVNGILTTTSGARTPIKREHPGIIKVIGYGYISIQSTPPTALVHTEDPTKTLSLINMRIVNSDGSAISNMNKVEIINGQMELKTVGRLTIPVASEVTRGEYKADWPITIDYVGYEPE